MKEEADPRKEARAFAGLALPAVLAAWLLMLAWAAWFVHAHAPLFPVLDDKNAWRTVLPPYGELTWKNLWITHNEHRIPLPRLVYYCLYRLTGDLRPGLYLQLAVLGAVPLGLIALARCVRGRTSFADVLFPVLWLHVGNAVNLLSGFQLALTLPTALVTAILAAAVLSPSPPRPPRALGAGVSLVALPLCGGAGMIQAPFLAAWLAWAGVRGKRSAERAERRGGRILLLSVLACAVLFATHLWGYAIAPGAGYRAPLGEVFSMAFALLGLGFGPRMQALWPAGAVLLLVLLALTVARLLVGLRLGGEERSRRLALLAVIAANACLAFAIARSRSDVDWRLGFPLRYVTLTTPLVCAVFLAWELFGGGLARATVRAGLALSALALLPGNVRIGLEHGRRIRSQVGELERAIEVNAGLPRILDLYFERFRGDPRLNFAILKMLSARHRPPFDHGRTLPPAAFDFPTFDRAPSRVETDAPLALRFVSGKALTVTAPGTRIHVEIRDSDATISGRFGVPNQLLGREGFGDARMVVEMVASGGGPVVLLDRTLRPAAVDADRGLQRFSIDLPPHGAGEIVLRTESALGSDPARGRTSRACWADLAIE